MLILELKRGKSIRLFDLKHNEDLGSLKYIGSRDKDAVALGFDAPDFIKILRSGLIGKEVDYERAT